MIDRISINNLFSFGQTDIRLCRDVNLLIGINGSGKSNFLKLLSLLKQGIGGVGLKKYVFDYLGGLDNLLTKNNVSETPDARLQITFMPEELNRHTNGFEFLNPLTYEITLVKIPGLTNFYVRETVANRQGVVYLEVQNGIGFLLEQPDDATDKDGKRIHYTDFDPQELALAAVNDTNRYPLLTALKRILKQTFVYEYFDVSKSSKIRKPQMPTGEKQLLPDGANLTQLLNTLKINHKQTYRQILNLLREVNPQFTELDFNFIGGNIELMLAEEGLNSAIHVSGISDGTLRFLCLLAICYNPNRGALVCIDEPETGLHPDMLLHVAEALKFAAQHTTMVVATHSDNLINYFEVEQVRVFEKNAGKLLSS